MKKWFLRLKKFLEKRDIEPKRKGEEKIFNIPNPITFSRVIITFIIIYIFIIGSSLIYVTLLFILGMLTDFLDGYFARRLNQVTEFGRQFDILADRFLFIATVSGLIITLLAKGLMNNLHLIQIFMVLSREIVAFPFALLALLWGKRIPDVRYIGKMTTVLQAVTFPMIILSVFNPLFNISIYLSVLTMIVGFFSGLYYLRDLRLGKK